MQGCEHIDEIPLSGGLLGATPGAEGCQDCGPGDRWVTLRRCLNCGHIGCCDSSPRRHASGHAREAGHPLVQSFEPGEDWIWCYEDEVLIETTGAERSPSHP